MGENSKHERISYRDSPQERIPLQGVHTRHYQNNHTKEKGPGQDKKLVKNRMLADAAREKVIRIESMISRIERFEPYLFEGGNSLRRLTGDDIFVDSEDKEIFKKACPDELNRIERREALYLKAEKKKQDLMHLEHLLRKLNNKLETRDPSSTASGDGKTSTSSIGSTATDSSRSTATDMKERHPRHGYEATVDMKDNKDVKHTMHEQLSRALDDRKTYMVEALQMEIALMIEQHPIVNDYQSPVNGPMYSELCHLPILHRTCITHTSASNSPLGSNPSPHDPKRSSPVVKLRIAPQIKACKDKIPRFARVKHTVFLLVLCCTCAAEVAHVGLSYWARVMACGAECKN